MEEPTIFEAAGGSAAMLRLAQAHHSRCLADPILSHPFSHAIHPEHVERLAAYWGEVFGGPPTFSATCGGHSAMLGLHAGCEMQAELGERFVQCFVNAADDAGLPSDLALRECLRAYMAWAVAQVMEVSPKGSAVPGGLAMPRWTWDGPRS